LKLVFLIVTRAVSLLGLWRRESWWKNAEILMLRHQLAVAEREKPGAHTRLAWPDRAWLALLAGTVPMERLSAMRLIVTPGTIVRWHREIVRRRWNLLSRRGRSGRPATHRRVRSLDDWAGCSVAPRIRMRRVPCSMTARMDGATLMPSPASSPWILR
jgi:putative transposase